MSVLDRIGESFIILGQIALVCVPVFLVLWLLDVLLQRISNKYVTRVLTFDWQAFFERKLAKAQAREKAAWEKRAQTIENRKSKEK